MKKIIYMLMMSMGLYTAASAQVKIGKNPTTITANSYLDVKSDNDSIFHVNKDNGYVGIGNATPSEALSVGSNSIVLHNGGNKIIGFNTN